MIRDTRPHTLIPALSLTHTEAFPLQACSGTRNLRIYFISVGRVPLIEWSYCRLYCETPGLERLFSCFHFAQRDSPGGR